MTIRHIADIASTEAPHILIEQDGRTVKVDAPRVFLNGILAFDFTVLDTKARATALKLSEKVTPYIASAKGTSALVDVLRAAVDRPSKADYDALIRNGRAWECSGRITRDIEVVRGEIAAAEARLADLLEQAEMLKSEAAEHEASAKAILLAA